MVKLHTVSVVSILLGSLFKQSHRSYLRDQHNLHFHIKSRVMAYQILVNELQKHLSDLKKNPSLPLNQSLLEAINGQISGTKQTHRFT